MYFAARQYPELRNMSRIQRLRFVAESIRANNKWIGCRLMFWLFIVMFSSGGVEFLPESLNIPEWGGTAVAIAGGILFYVHMLWELNGPLLRAVRSHATGTK